LHRRTVQKWLQESGSVVEPAVETEGLVPTEAKHEDSGSPKKPTETVSPPAPWNDWDEVHQVREALQEYRFLFVKQPQHLNAVEQERVADSLHSPIGNQLQIPYTFMRDWFAFWHFPDHHRLPPEEAPARFRAWQACEAYQQVKPLQRVLERITPNRFDHLRHFLKDDHWEATINGAERTGRNPRH
jgi:hypothetical protein